MRAAALILGIGLLWPVLLAANAIKAAIDLFRS